MSPRTQNLLSLGVIAASLVIASLPAKSQTTTNQTEAAMILGLRTAIYPAPDLKRAKAWYEQVLGIPPYFDEPFYVGFAVGGFELGLLPDAQPGVDGTRTLWGVDDAHKELARLVALGATVIEPVADVGEGIRVAAVRDPFGNRFGIIENPQFKPADVR